MSEPLPDPRPKPGFSLPLSRQRLIELGVVVFGVLIALGLDNLVQEVRLRGDAHELEKAFKDDIGAALENGLERQVVAPCQVQALSALTERVVASEGSMEAAPASQTGNLVFAMSQPYRSPVRLWTTSTFDRALGTEAFKRIPRERADAYSALFSQIEMGRENNAAEYLAAAGLAPLAYAQNEMNVEVRAELLQNLALLDRQQALTLLMSSQFIEAAMSSPAGDDIRAELLAHQSEMGEAGARWKAIYGDCVDLGAIDRLLEMAAL